MLGSLKVVAGLVAYVALLPSLGKVDATPLLEQRAPPVFNLGMQSNVTLVTRPGSRSSQTIGGIQYFGDDPSEPQYLIVSEDLDSTWLASRILDRIGFVYELAPGPHTVATNDDGFYYVVGGIVWSQIRRFAFTDGTESSSQSLSWTVNTDYDRRWEQFGPRVPQPLLWGDQGHEEQLSRLHMAGFDSRAVYRLYMQELTSSRNTDASDDQRVVLRELLDWDPDLEPDPLMAIDWTTVKIPERLQKKLLGGLPTGDECGQVVREVFRDDSSEASSTTCEALVEKAHDFNRKPAERVGIVYAHEPVAGPSTSQGNPAYVNTGRVQSRPEMQAASGSCRDNVAEAFDQNGESILPHLLDVEEAQHRRCTEVAAEVARIERQIGHDGTISERQVEDFLLQAANNSVSAEAVMESIDGGLESFRSSFPELFDLMRTNFPALFQALRDAHIDGIEMRSCGANTQSPSKRQEPGTKSKVHTHRAQLRERSCRRLEALRLYRKGLTGWEGPCLAINKLQVTLSMGIGARSGLYGTKDTIFVGVGESPALEQVLDDPWGFSKATKKIDLKWAFGSENVALHKIRLVRLYAQENPSWAWYARLEWMFKGESPQAADWNQHHISTRGH
ncbi:hypothetical protein ACCO45_006182 [Purpureocillium lilacinum]|uniref:Uncharacterized protein n=1 Tax=Purpureocillium lilacinum TaxID=33203 RepID=A0ACC4DXE3_PURLI